MNRINKYFNSIGKLIIFSRLEVFQHPGGKSFYNDGLYQEEVYQVVGTPYILRNKVTGRKMYMLYNGSTLVGLEYSQRDFIEKVLKVFL